MKNYKPLCPLGRMNCIHDSAYIQCYFPEWYNNLPTPVPKCLKDLCPYDLILEIEDEYGPLEND